MRGNVKDIKIRFTKDSDAKYMAQWIDDPKIIRWFPMTTKAEILDSVNICMGYAKHKAMLTAEYNKEVCGVACLYLQSFEKISHSCLFVIVVDEKYRGKGIGKELMLQLSELAKSKFNLQILHLEVYDTNPAILFYEKLGFDKYGYQKKFIKEADGTYLGKTLMQKFL